MNLSGYGSDLMESARHLGPAIDEVGATRVGLHACWLDIELTRGTSPAPPAGAAAGFAFAARLALELSIIACARDAAGAGCLGCCCGA